MADLREKMQLDLTTPPEEINLQKQTKEGLMPHSGSVAPKAKKVEHQMTALRNQIHTEMAQIDSEIDSTPAATPATLPKHSLGWRGTPDSTYSTAPHESDSTPVVTPAAIHSTGPQAVQSNPVFTGVTKRGHKSVTAPAPSPHHSYSSTSTTTTVTVPYSVLPPTSPPTRPVSAPKVAVAKVAPSNATAKEAPHSATAKDQPQGLWMSILAVGTAVMLLHN